MQKLILSLMLVLSVLTTQKVKISNCWSDSETFYKPRLFKNNEPQSEITLDEKLVSFQIADDFSLAWFKSKDLHEIRFQSIPKIKQVTKYYKAVKTSGYNMAIFAKKEVFPKDVGDVNLKDLLSKLSDGCFDSIQLKIGVILHEVMVCCTFELLEQKSVI